MICSQCKKEFAANHPTRKYCSKECSQKAYKEYQKNYRQQEHNKKKASQYDKKYRKSANGKKIKKNARNKYEKSEKFRNVQKKYREQDYVKLRNTIYHKNYEQLPKTKLTRKIYRGSDRHRKILRDYIRHRRKTDPIFKLIDTARSRLATVLKKKNIDKPTTKKFKSTTIKLFGCTPEFLKRHIEKQFKPGMNWENHTVNGWHIDHIDPLDLAMNEDDIIILSHYTNLRPMWATENLKKGNKINFRN